MIWSAGKRKIRVASSPQLLFVPAKERHNSVDRTRPDPGLLHVLAIGDPSRRRQRAPPCFHCFNPTCRETAACVLHSCPHGYLSQRCRVRTSQIFLHGVAEVQGSEVQTVAAVLDRRHQAPIRRAGASCQCSLPSPTVNSFMMMIVALAAGRVGNVLIIQDKDMHAKYFWIGGHL